MKKSLLNIGKAIEEVGRALLKNRVVMIICVFIIFFVVVGGINFMQKKTMEHFSYDLSALFAPPSCQDQCFHTYSNPLGDEKKYRKCKQDCSQAQ